tara:strand:+ start:288 stop:527 length:240 start_codon:yes stop_codon:yes gene_type:complete
MAKDNRYVVQMDMYIYAENDYMARKRAHKMKDEIDKDFPNARPMITEIGSQPFGTMAYTKLKDKSEPLSRSEKEEDLPF